MRKLTALLILLVMIPLAASADGMITLKKVDTVHNDTPFGKCVVPAGYTVAWDLLACTTDQSIGFPCQAMITAGKPNGPQMLYLSANDFYETSNPSMEGKENTFDPVFRTTLLSYMTAEEYCDRIAGKQFIPMADGGNVTPVGSKPLPELEALFQQMLAPKIEEMRATYQEPFGSFDDYRVSMAMKVYEYTVSGVQYYGIVLTGNYGVWVSMYGTKKMSYGNWVVPFTYVMYARGDDPDAISDFEVFVANTNVSDQFNHANLKLSVSLWNIVKESFHLYRDQVYKTIAEETAMGDDYDEDRITDYIFDQNDYTLEDGTHVKVSTGYSYVWEDDNGNVYASNSLSDQPGGSRQLYPNP